jgi:hypothetical protein
MTLRRCSACLAFDRPGGHLAGADLLMRVDRSDGTHKDTFFRFQRNDEGWQLIVPSNVLSGYAKQLGMSAPAP